MFRLRCKKLDIDKGSQISDHKLRSLILRVQAINIASRIRIRIWIILTSGAHLKSAEVNMLWMSSTLKGIQETDLTLKGV